MKYFWCMLIVLAACFGAAGCRRGAGEPRTPMKIDLEGDILKGPRENVLMFAARPLSRKFRLFVTFNGKGIYDLENEYKDPGKLKTVITGMLKAQDELEKDKEGAKIVMALTAAADAAEERYEFEEFGKKAYEYLDLKKATPKEFIVLEFYKYIRRKDYLVERKFVDKALTEIVGEPVYLTKFMDQGRMSFVTAVDMNKAADYIIAYVGGGGGGPGGMGGGAAPMAAPPGLGGGGATGSLTMMGNKSVVSMSAGEIKQQIRTQELKLLHLHFMTFATPLLLRPPLEDVEFQKRWRKNGLGSYANIVGMMQYPGANMPPRAILQHIDDNFPEMAKQPPEARDMEKFMKLFKENAPPSVVKNLEDQVIFVNPAVDFRLTLAEQVPPQLIFDKRYAPYLQGGGPGIVACRPDPDWARDEVAKVDRLLGHWCILADGRMAYMPTAIVAGFLPPPKKKAAPPDQGGVPPLVGGGPPPMMP